MTRATASLSGAAQAFDGLRIVPPGFGICHQVNLEFLSRVRSREGRRALSGHARRNRLPHHDDQRPRRRGLGRRRHRSGGGDARAARVSPHARRRRRASPRPSARGSRPPPIWSSASPSCCGKQVWSASSWSSTVKVPPACRFPTERRSGTWRPSTARPSASSRSTSSPADTSARPDGATSTWRPCAATSRRRGCSGCPRETMRLHERPRPGPGQCRAVRRRSEAAAGSHRARTAQGAVPDAAHCSPMATEERRPRSLGP